MATQSRGKRTQALVLDAALPLLAKDGLRTRIEDISAASGVSVGSIYHHFDNREGVINAVYGQQLSLLVDELALATTTKRTLREGVVAFIARYVDWMVEHPDSATLIYAIGPIGAAPQTLSVAATSKSAAITQLTRWLHTFAENGDVRIGDPTVVELILLGPVREYCQRLLAGVITEPPEVVVPQLAEAAWRAIAT